MSRAADAGADVEPTDEVRGIDWLERNARQINPKDRVGTDLWDKAKLTRSNADVDELNHDDLYRVERPDGDPHLVLFVTHTNDAHAGACSCEGFNFESCCRHLLALAQLDVTDDILRTDDRRAEDLLQDEVVEPDPDVQEYDGENAIDDDLPEHLTRVSQIDGQDILRCQACGSEMEEAEPTKHKVGCPHGQKPDDWPEDNGDPTSVYPDEVVPASSDDATVQPQDSSGENRAADTSNRPFAGELPDVGKEYVMEMGGETYIRRAGYARLARSEGYRLSFDEVVGAHETDWTRSKYRVVVLDESGEQVAEDVGTAGPPQNEDMAAAESNLDELAATRAATRALAWETGEGLTAVEEIAEQHAETTR